MSCFELYELQINTVHCGCHCPSVHCPNSPSWVSLFFFRLLMLFLQTILFKELKFPSPFFMESRQDFKLYGTKYFNFPSMQFSCWCCLKNIVVHYVMHTSIIVNKPNSLTCNCIGWHNSFRVFYPYPTKHQIEGEQIKIICCINTCRKKGSNTVSIKRRGEIFQIKMFNPNFFKTCCRFVLFVWLKLSYFHWRRKKLLFTCAGCRANFCEEQRTSVIVMLRRILYHATIS